MENCRTYDKIEPYVCNKILKRGSYFMYKVLKKDGKAKRAHMETVHGTIETPVFMNVGTVAAIKGAVSV